jgi:hypothetical protein
VICLLLLRGAYPAAYRTAITIRTLLRRRRG